MPPMHTFNEVGAELAEAATTPKRSPPTTGAWHQEARAHGITVDVLVTQLYVAQKGDAASRRQNGWLIRPPREPRRNRGTRTAAATGMPGASLPSNAGGRSSTTARPVLHQSARRRLGSRLPTHALDPTRCRIQAISS